MSDSLALQINSGIKDHGHRRFLPNPGDCRSDETWCEVRRGERTINDLEKLAALIKHEGDALLSRWREQVRQLPSAKHLDVPTLNDHIPTLLEELATALQSSSDEMISEALSEGSPPAHGLQRLQDEFDIEEVVAEYNILRGCIHDLADTNG
ncbi:MAG: RsbRD N-terminal domain-containing protein, partial [Acidobacteria bacterium]|nr:RsbRD N-terminal domain-containing protein [Acidobacteriota bacterium]